MSNKNNTLNLDRKEIYKRDGYVCAYCGETDRSLFTLDHIVPIVKGGDRFDSANIVTCCTFCNKAKGQMDPLEWLVNKHQILSKRRTKLHKRLGNRPDLPPLRIAS